MKNYYVIYINTNRQFRALHTMYGQHLSFDTDSPTMLVKVTEISSSIAVDNEGISLILKACDALNKGLATIDDLWPGKTYELST